MKKQTTIQIITKVIEQDDKKKVVLESKAYSIDNEHKD